MSNNADKDAIPSSIEEVLRNLDEINKNFQILSKIEGKTMDTEIQILERIFERIQPILPFIHRRIELFNDQFYNGNEYVGITVLSRERFLTLVEITDERGMGNHSFESSAVLFCLTDTLLIRKYSYQGFWSRYQNSAYYNGVLPREEYKMEDRNYEQIKTIVQERFEVVPLTAVLANSTFDSIIKRIIESFTSAIITNKKKANVLSSRLKLLRTVESLL